MMSISINLDHLIGTELNERNLAKKYFLERYYTIWSDDEEEDIIFVSSVDRDVVFKITVSRNYNIIWKAEQLEDK